MQVDRTIDRFVLDLSIRNGLSCRGAYLDQEKDYLSGSTKATYQNKAYLSKNDPNLHNTPKDAIVFGAAVNAVVAPCFARGKYRQILNEAKYYQAIESIYDDFTAAVERSAAQDTVYVQQIKHQDTIMLFVLQLGSCSGSDIPQGGRRGGNCGGTCAHGGHDVGFVPQQAACNDRHLCAGADLGDDPGHDAGKDLDKIRLALLQLTGQAGQREGIQDECPLNGQQAAVARPADQGRAGGDDAVRAAQGVEGVHRDLPRRKAVHKVDVNHGQFSGIMYAVHQTVYGEQGACQQKNSTAGRGQRSSQGFVRFHSGNHRFVQQGFGKRMHWVRLLFIKCFYYPIKQPPCK